MVGFPFRLTSETKKKLGLIVLQADQTIETEFRKVLPSHCDLYHSRIPSEPHVTPETLKKMTKDLPAAAALFPTSLNLDVIAYACTSGATIIGPRQIENIIRKVHRAVEVIDPISAACDALQVLQARSIGFVSPYIISVSKDLRNHFTTKGFQITSSISFDEQSESVVASINERDTLKAIEAAASEEVDAIFVSCTNLKSFSILNEAERITGKPVLSSNQALVWSMLKKAKVILSESELNEFPGKIFTKKYY